MSEMDARPEESIRTASQALAGLQTTLTPQQAEAWLAEWRVAFDLLGLRLIELEDK